MNMPDSVTSRIFRNVMETYSAQVVRILGALAFNIWLTRLLTPEERGYYGVALAVAMISVQFGQTGLNTANTYFVAKEAGIGNVLLGNSTIAAIAIGPILILAIFIISKLIPSAIALPGSCLFVAICYLPFLLGYLFFQGLLLGTHQIRKYNFIEILNRYIPLVILAIFVVMKAVAAKTALIAILIGQAIACIWSWVSLYIYSGGISYSMPLMLDMLRYGFRIHLATVFSFLLFRADLLMVAHMRSSTEAGYYSLATSLAEYMSLPASVVGMILLPHLSALQKSPQKFGLMMRWLTGMAIITLPVFIISAYIGSPVIHLLFGEKYLPSIPGFVWLLPGIYFLGLACVSVQFITSIGYKLSVSVAWFAVLILNLAGNLYAIPHYGFVGASIMSSICYALAFVLIFLIAWRNRKSQSGAHRLKSAAPLEANISYTQQA
jgi:O-antigen/teichoic acid export membrane protein